MDLEIRGPGDYLGTRQSGMPDLIFGNLIRDSHILKDARDTAFSLIEEDPDLEKEAHRELRTFIMERWGDRIDFAFT
jgi:ATP-dependent DNA helicase RecG